jgi:hypothetical protein
VAQIVDGGGLEHLKQFEQGRLIQGHRVLLLREFLYGSRKDSHGGPSTFRSHHLGLRFTPLVLLFDLFWH